MSNKASTVTEAMLSRRSVRAFTQQPVSGDVIRRLLSTAARAPSGGNLQPWQIFVVGGDELTRLKAIMRKRVQEAPRGEEPEYAVYPEELVSPYRDYRFQLGEDLYAELGIPREDKDGRMAWFAQNYQFFDAPLALFCYVDRRMGPPQWSDLGMFLQSLMLLLREEGLDSCAQECWSLYHRTLADYLEPPEELMLFTGMSIGYADTGAPANQLRSRRAPLEEFARFRGI
ncbi:nitroreductase [Halopseudomonas laoshanensis]|uniref:Nitroreductase n=1 Tax=Halopseudomonas laoshanensis TaxID=2268758 RepID=A0A7V7KU16_9GAMM|nr:nitroreductase [Halopseudomonas laoshanensis]KAA0691838.1 nitroreductase [Halopseudomonas laoshanensis]